MLEWVGALVITIAVSAVAFLGASRMQKVLGRHVIAAFERLMGLVLTAISIDMLLKGLESYLKGVSA
jgi:small neutral amino acid transporter SnatA (MarC family)